MTELLNRLRTLDLDILLNFGKEINKEEFLILTDLEIIRTMVLLSGDIKEDSDIMYLQFVAVYAERPEWFTKIYNDFFHNPLDK